MTFTTFVSRSSSSLLCRLSKVVPDPNAVMLFTLSANADASNLEAIVSRLRLLAPHTVGCLSSPLPGASETINCSTATFPSQHCLPFRSEIPGKAPIQVGRWNRKTSVDTALPNLTQNISNWGDSWEHGRDPLAPTELLGQSDIRSLVFFSDDAPEGLVRSLGEFPQADKLGLVASSTPFITGRPFTLFHNEHIYSSGAVGLALKLYPRPVSATSFHGLIALSTPMAVSRSEGNLVHELNQSNPSKMLIEAIAADSPLQSMSKDDDFFLGHFYSESSVAQKLRRVYRILSGGPSRGSIALDTVKAPEEGETVQFFRRAPHSSLTALESLNLHIGDETTIRFLCSSYEDTPSHETPAEEEETVQVLQDTFLAASENGFLGTETTSSRPMWKCVVPGAVGSLTWASS